jgi:putative hemolysin
MLATLSSMYHMRINKVSKFKPKIQIENRIGNFIYKTVSTSEELRSALSLRYEVFHREMLGKTKAFGLDVDEFDSVCDHLIIIDSKKNLVVGTYRMNCSLFSDRFYSQNEFMMARVLAHPGVKLELGRACIHKDYRRGMVISMLWKGIGDYMVATNADILFGCATVKTTNPREAALLYRYFLEENRIAPQFFTPPTLEYTMPNLNFWVPSFQNPLSLEERTEAEGLIPGLCRTYLNCGAFIGGEPAYDKEFKCIDFMTVMKKSDLRKHLWKKIGGN